MKTLIAVFILLSLEISCTSSSSYYGPDGTKIYTTKCYGTNSNMPNCFNRAHEKCDGKGYNVILNTYTKCEASEILEKPIFGTGTSCRILKYSCKK